jgi:hypothetical protein
VSAAKNIAPLISATDLVVAEPSAYDELERITAGT